MTVDSTKNVTIMVVPVSQEYETLTVALFTNYKMLLSKGIGVWDHFRERDNLTLEYCLGARLKGYVQITSGAIIVGGGSGCAVKVNDVDLGHVEETSQRWNYDFDVYSNLAEGFNRFIFTLYRTGIGAVVDASYIGSMTLELYYEVGHKPKPPVVVDGGCFVATVAFGSALAPELDVIRGFRDHCLPNLLTHAYYRVGRYLARFIERRRALKAFVRAALWLVFIRHKS